MPDSRTALLDRTYNVLKGAGLAKQTHRTRDGRLCIFGALENARKELGLTHDQACDAAWLLYASTGCGSMNPATVNDLPRTTLDTMLDIIVEARGRSEAS